METLNMQHLNNVGPSSLYDAGMGRQPHNMFPDVHVGAFEQEQLKNSMVFEPAVDWQALSDAGLPNFPKSQTPGPSTTAPSTFDQDFGTLVQTVDPTDLWSDTSAAAGEVSNGKPPASTSESSQGRIPTESTSPTSPSKASTPPSTGPSTRSTRARNAANRRHSKAKVARKDSHHDDEGSAEAGSASPSAIDSKTQRLREKNKLAAAKCRSRQRKQVQIIESKCNHLSAANSELKRQVRDLAGELNRLRAFALQHQGCNCQVASYNLDQARRVAADLQAFGTTGVEVQQKQQLRRQSGLEA